MQQPSKHYHVVPLTFNRRAVIASATVNKEKNTIHCITDADLTEPRRLMLEHLERTGEKLSLTAYIVACLAQTIKKHPLLNSFQKGRKLVIMDDVTVNVLIEREYSGEKVPEPIGILAAQNKSFMDIHKEIREAKEQTGAKLGSLSGMTWVRLIPGFLLRTFIRIADRNIRLGLRYGKVCVTAVGMFSKDAAWFVPHGTATVLVTVGGISEKIVKIDNQIVAREYICLTVSFDHNIVDGAPAARFMKDFTELIKSGKVLLGPPKE
jgi:pyruvate/2-oxoglutarate dehydrogenase complex dihydrolipoamide acyltransferase (E2) component